MASPLVNARFAACAAGLASLLPPSFFAAGCIGVSAKRTPPNGPGTVAVLRCRATKPAVDDFEDGNNQLTKMGGRDGYWFNAVDKSGSTIDMHVDEPGAGGSEMALHATGVTVPGTAENGQWGAQIGVHMVNQGVTYDASKYAGFSFKAKVGPGSGRQARFKIGDVNTHPDAGICKTCWNHFGMDLSLTPEWKEYKVLFSAAQQEAGWGDPRPQTVSPEKLVSIDWTIGPGQTYDIWIDDINLLECAD